MPKKQAGENTKKASGNAKKAEAAALRTAAENSKNAVVEDAEWSKGAKSNTKKEEAEAKKQDAVRRKAEKDALLAAEEASNVVKPKPVRAAFPHKVRPLDLSTLDDDALPSSINASGIDNALDALTLTSGADTKVDRHPERRFKAAYAAFEARRLPELEEEHKGLRKQQRVDMIRKEFERSPENPFNQANVEYDASKEDIKAIKAGEREKIEQRLGGS